MKLGLLLSSLLVLGACGSSEKPSAKPGNGGKGTDEKSVAPEPPLTLTRVEGPTLPPDDPTLSEQYLVILASKLDPAEVEPALAAARAQGELGAKARTLLSSRFKNLMPCYHVGIADAFADKKAAFALSKKLTAAGVDNYVKNAGAYVGASPAIDAFCAGFTSEDVANSVARVLVVAGGKSWLPAEGALPEGLPAATVMDERFGAWIQPAAADAGDAEEPARWNVLDLKTGKVQACGRKGYAVLTLGTPHFGVLQGEEKPTEPACGEPALYAELDCALAEGMYVATPDGAKAPSALTAKGEVAALAELARAEVERLPGWRDYVPSSPEAAITRTIRVLKYEGSAGAFHVVEGNIEDGEGVCGGDEVAFRALYAADGEGLGRRLGPYLEEHFSRLEAVIDLEGDGAPELYTVSFPDDQHAWRADGSALTSSTIAFCDCAC